MTANMLESENKNAVRPILKVLLLSLASLAAVIFGIWIFVLIFGHESGLGKFALGGSAFLILVPVLVLLFNCRRHELSFRQTTIAAFALYFIMYVAFSVGLGAGHGMFSVGSQYAIIALGSVVILAIIICLPIALVSAGVLRGMKQGTAGSGRYDSIQSTINRRNVIEYACTLGFALVGLMAGYYIEGMLAQAGTDGFSTFSRQCYGQPLAVFGLPVGATIGVLFANRIIYKEKGPFMVSAAMSFVAGLGGVFALMMLSLVMWTAIFGGQTATAVLTSLLSMLGYHRFKRPIVPAEEGEDNESV